MTCIVGVTDGERVVLGADSASASQHDLYIRATHKLFQRGQYGFGFTRSWRMGQILEHVSELPEPPEDITCARELEHFMVASFVPAIRESFAAHGYAKSLTVARSADYTEVGQDAGGVFLVALYGHLFEVREDYQVVRPATPYAAVGAGAIAALGALHALHAHTEMSLFDLAEAALEASEMCSQYVRNPFCFLDLR